MKHDEYHRQFAEGIIEQIRQGTAPWQKPWGPGERVLPANVDTGRSYAGGNSLHLAAVQQERGYGDVRWGTYRQIQARDGQVRKGEQGTRILSFQDHRRIAVNDERGRPKRDNEGKRVYRHERLKAPFVRQYTVFNAEQADGLPDRPTPTAEPLWKVHQQAERVLDLDGDLTGLVVDSHIAPLRVVALLAVVEPFYRPAGLRLRREVEARSEHLLHEEACRYSLECVVHRLGDGLLGGIRLRDEIREASPRLPWGIARSAADDLHDLC